MSTSETFDGCLPSTDAPRQTFHLVWADSSVNDAYNHVTHEKIQSLLNGFLKFEQGSACQAYLEQSSIHERFLVIVSGRFGREIASQIEKIRQVASIFVYCMDKKANEKWASQHPKIRAVVVSSDELLAALQTDLPIRLQLDEPFALNLLSKSEAKSAIYFHLFLRALPRMKANRQDQNELLRLLETECKDEKKGWESIQEYKKDPASHELLAWFTPHSIFNQIFTRALLEEDFHRLFLFHPFLSQLSLQLKATPPFSIYRSQLVSTEELHRLKSALQQFISLPAFSFGLLDRADALNAAPSSPAGFHRLLFQIDVPSPLGTLQPFATLGTSEVLIMPAPVFRLREITAGENQLFLVKMSLCTEEEYKTLLQSFAVQVQQPGEQANLRTLAKIFWKMGRFDLATVYYKRFLKQLPANDPWLVIIYEDLGMMSLQQKLYSESVDWFRQAAEVKKSTSPGQSLPLASFDYFPDLASNIPHPPCPQIDSCDQLHDEGHRRVYLHRFACPEGGQCSSLENEAHRQQFTHPSPCPREGECLDISEEHLTEYSHVPLCKDGPNCLLLFKEDHAHRLAFRHCKKNCPFRSFCADFHHLEHIEEENHPFKPPCPYTPYMCQYHARLMSNESEGAACSTASCVQHCLRYAHVCPWGRACPNRTNKNHCETNIHIFRMECSQGEHCPAISDVEHCHSFSHRTIADIRPLCPHSTPDCLKHLKEYRHSAARHAIGVASYLALNKGIRFLQNQTEMIENIHQYPQASPVTVPDAVRRWIRALQPVHRCSKLIFESILLHGHCMSREHMNSLRQPQTVAKAIQNHKAIQRIFAKASNTRLQQTCEEYFHLRVEEHFGTHQSTTLSKEQLRRLKEIETIFSTLEITEADLKTVRQWITAIAEASYQLYSTQTGIGWQADADLGTNKHVFAILGPHAGYYYGDIILVFRPEIMLHPDSNFSIQAATTFHTSGNAYRWRPWLKDPAALPKRIEHFHRNKLHCSLPGYDLAAASELLALQKNSTKDLDLPAIRTRWMTLDPHQVFEAHLPQLIPLDYIERVYIAETTFQSLSSQAQQSARTIFGEALCITPHQVTGDTPGIKQAIDPARRAFQTFAMEETFKAIEQRSNALPPHPGTTITLAPSAFREFVHLPMTISEALKQGGPAESVYIYWEALRGDLTVVLTYERIDTDIDQKNLKCLTSHIAKWPRHNLLTTSSTPTTSDYQEGYSYISTYHPYTHYHIIHGGKVQASSNTFHRGCNTDDFVLYNLVLHRRTSQVTLAIVGANSLYTQRGLSYTFQKKDLDLTKLEHVQISAGGTVVPVRNFLIQSTPIEKFHPAIDRAFLQAYPATAKPPPQLQKTPSSASLARKPCSGSVYCELQYQETEEGRKHIAEFSHPCRFSELCRRKEAHLVHWPHPVPRCSADQKCSKLGDPVHRAEYRHTDLPDYLIPCRFQEKCKVKAREEHRSKYFHGEKVPLPS